MYLNSTHNQKYLGLWNRTGTGLDSTFDLYSFDDPTVRTAPIPTLAVLPDFGSVHGSWDPGQFITVPGSKPTGGKACKKHHWVYTPEPVNGTGHDWDVEYVGVFLFDAITQFLQNLSVTPKTQMALVETNGLMMASSVDRLLYNQYGNDSVNIDACQSPLLRAAASHIQDTYGTYTSLPKTYSARFSSPEDGNVFLDTVRIQDGLGLDLIGILAVPEDDLVGTMKNTRQTAAVTVTVVAVLMMVVAGLASHLFTLPLRRLCQIMRMATVFDFSSVRDNDMTSRRSFLREIAIMESAFIQMLKEFAKAIEKNKVLAGNRKSPDMGSDHGQNEQEDEHMSGSGDPRESV
ncbi:uncharacterized protein EV422DRAFT_288818 [Fimicolochytrium jonesii]|uniref:uncharacterized protein n=1 Tax=Fimicolochytrium jonesii TaxID=1396493 RepID=UPI0022FE5642|nr:uncharacterized protein EV422DRAFT_288818 [Fimicolochytrium jonesii]KAI8816550.1 hypothetical protein EV422DRAFT_288818 [Fimicolochytrium jonesii]